MLDINDSFSLIQERPSSVGFVRAPAIDMLYWGGGHLGAFRCFDYQTVGINRKQIFTSAWRSLASRANFV